MLPSNSSNPKTKRAAKKIVVAAGFSLEIYFQMVHSTIGMYKHPVYTNVKWETRIVTAMGMV